MRSAPRRTHPRSDAETRSSPWPRAPPTARGSSRPVPRPPPTSSRSEDEQPQTGVARAAGGAVRRIDLQDGELCGQFRHAVRVTLSMIDAVRSAAARAVADAEQRCRDRSRASRRGSNSSPAAGVHLRQKPLAQLADAVVVRQRAARDRGSPARSACSMSWNWPTGSASPWPENAIVEVDADARRGRSA